MRVRTLLVAALMAACSTAPPSIAVARALAASPRHVSIVITERPPRSTRSTTARFAWKTPDAYGTRCKLDRAMYRKCSSPTWYKRLAPGRHVFSVRAYRGRTSTTGLYRWTITRSPAPSPAGVANPGSATGSSPLAASTATASTVSPAPLGVSGNWTLRFDDEFNGGSLDLTKWQPNWLAGNYTDTTPPDNSSQANCESPGQVSVGNGYLAVTAQAATCKADNGKTYGFASGLINTHRSYVFTRGYIEARILVPAAGGACDNWPAFWADGQAVNGISWPTFGESDVVECLSDGFNYHFHSNAGGPGTSVPLGNPGGWHTFGADLEPGTQSCASPAPDPVLATYYYDGVRVGSISACIYNTGMYMILDNDISSFHGGPQVLPATMRVDYVRAWQ